MHPARTAKPANTAVILLVDDDERVRRALGLVLQSQGHEVISCPDGESAIEVARDRVLDLAVVDRRMSGIDGIDVLQQLREMQPMCNRVLLSGSIDVDTAIAAVNQGAAAHVLEKPVGIDELTSLVEDTMRRRERMIEAASDLQRMNRSASRMRLLTLLAGPDLRLAIQPIVRAETNGIVAYEALLRSADPVLSGPLAVLRAAEEHNLVGRLGEAVMVRAAGILDRLPGDGSLFINLHPDELADPDGLCERLDVLRASAERVVLEITERSSLSDARGWEKSIEAILSRGFRVAVDDLGSGYSSLSVLAELQPSFIKIDMSIVRDIDHIPRKQRLFDLLCRFADATETLVVAEGIETAAEAETVKRCGAHLLQGYFYARPEPWEKVLGDSRPTA